MSDIPSGALRVANCSGFFGDRVSAAKEMVDGGPIDVLTGDWLAELTMLILARSRAKRPGCGWARTFLSQMEQVMGTCLDRGIKVVSNAGGLDPEGCAEAVSECAGRLGLAPRIAVVIGDDVMDRFADLVAAGSVRPFDDGPAVSAAAALTANAYLGCWGIVDALAAGADIVICGRVTDAALTCGPAAWRHGWTAENFDALAGAVVAGHVLECGAQATGGNYSFFDEVPAFRPGAANPRLGFPWADVFADGSSIIGMHDDSPGLVSRGTVTSQLLYEIGGPRYLGPDVVARFDSIVLDEVAPNRVRLAGVKGEAPPPTLKVATNSFGGFRNQVSVALTGLDIEDKARVVETVFWDLCPFGPNDIAQCHVELIRTDAADPSTNPEATAVWRMVVHDADDTRIGRPMGAAMIESALASIPGMYALGGGPPTATPFGVYRPAVIDRDQVAVQYRIFGDDRWIDVADRSASVAAPAPVAPAAAARSDRAVISVDTDVSSVPLGTVVGARSGDKGGDANVGVFARSEQAWEWLDDYLTADRLAELLPEVADLVVERYRFPNLWALNFVVRGLLGEGVAASVRQDAQAKSLGEWLRSRIVEVPTALL